MRATMALISIIAALSLMLAYGPASAQDVAPETPPELRDFRLDPQPARPTAQPTVEPGPVTPPPAVATVPEAETPSPTVRTPTIAPQHRQTSAPAADQPAREAETGDAAVVPPAVNADPATVDDPATEVSEPRPEPTPSPANQNRWQIAAALGLIGVVLMAFYRFRRSRKQAAQSDAVIAEPAAVAEPPKTAIPVKVAPRPTPPILKPKLRIAIDFVPEKASISVTTLTIKGQLRVINESDLVAKDMQLRAALISASAHQDAEIAAFHQAAMETSAQHLGDARAGERIGMAIELTVPLADLQSFPLGDQQLFVPLMVANLAYGGDDGAPAEIAQIACMIGREANPPKPKMAPLRLDLGPRSFSPLGQRPVLIA